MRVGRQIPNSDDGECSAVGSRAGSERQVVSVRGHGYNLLLDLLNPVPLPERLLLETGELRGGVFAITDAWRVLVIVVGEAGEEALEPLGALLQPLGKSGRMIAIDTHRRSALIDDEDLLIGLEREAGTDLRSLFKADDVESNAALLCSW